MNTWPPTTLATELWQWYGPRIRYQRELAGRGIYLGGERLNAVWWWKRNGGELDEALERFGVNVTPEQKERIEQ